MSSAYYAKGRYICEVTNQALGEAGTGTPQIVIRFRVLRFENGDDVNEQYERSAYLYLTEKTVDRTVAVLKSLGFSKDGFRYIDKSQPGYQDLSGQEFTGFCNHEANDKGDTKEKWGIAIDSDGTFEVKPLESKKLREIDMLFGKALKGNAPKGPVPVVTQAQAGEVDLGDVPF